MEWWNVECAAVVGAGGRRAIFQPKPITGDRYAGPRNGFLGLRINYSAGDARAHCVLVWKTGVEPEAKEDGEEGAHGSEGECLNRMFRRDRMQERYESNVQRAPIKLLPFILRPQLGPPHS